MVANASAMQAQRSNRKLITLIKQAEHLIMMKRYLGELIIGGISGYRHAYSPIKPSHRHVLIGHARISQIPSRSSPICSQRSSSKLLRRDSKKFFFPIR